MPGLLQNPAIRKLVLYAICGGTGVAVDFALFAALVYGNVWYQAANAAGYAAGTIVSFVLNRAITFKVKDAPLRRFSIFVAVACVGFATSSAALWLMVDMLHLDPVIAKIITLGIVLVLQFSLNSLITFRTSRVGEPIGKEQS